MGGSAIMTFSYFCNLRNSCLYGKSHHNVNHAYGLLYGFTQQDLTPSANIWWVWLVIHPPFFFFFFWRLFDFFMYAKVIRFKKKCLTQAVRCFLKTFVLMVESHQTPLWVLRPRLFFSRRNIDLGYMVKMCFCLCGKILSLIMVIIAPDNEVSFPMESAHFCWSLYEKIKAQ